MRKNIRSSFAAALAAVAVSSTAASAAVPAWFDGSDRNEDSRVSWTEFVRHHSNFDRMDENADGVITRSDHFLLEGREESSLTYLEYLDANENGAVSRSEYTNDLRASFTAFDRNGNGTISAREVDDARGVRPADARRREGRDLNARRMSRSCAIARTGRPRRGPRRGLPRIPARPRYLRTNTRVGSSG